MNTANAADTFRSPRTRASTTAALACALSAMFLFSAGGCIAGAVGALGQQVERGKKLDVPAEYDGLDGKTVAVVVQADYATLVEHPLVVENVTKNVAARIARNVPKTSVLAPIQVLEWQYRTPQWRALPYGEVARELGVDRLISISMSTG
jgi:hypothetical protein